jgi:hypothetical protein
VRKITLTDGEKEMIGQKFNKLTVIDKGFTRNKNKYWLCECECGNKKYAMTAHLKSGIIKACGCMQGTRAWKEGFRLAEQPNVKLARKFHEIMNDLHRATACIF